MFPDVARNPMEWLSIHSDRINMNTIFVPGVPIQSVQFNENGQRLASSVCST